MLRTPMIMALAVVFGTTGCDVDKAPAADTPHSVSISIDAGGDTTPGGGNTPGKVEITLPGGIAAKVDVPGGIEKGGKFDIAGVGLFPGAKVGSVKVNAGAAAKAQKATVEFGFSAPGDAAAVADWYQREFDARGTAVTRRGESVSGTTKDGDSFTIAMEPAGTGTSRGLVTITDTN
jgi:hypothetical protein